MNVLVFRTNINSAQRVHKAACRLCKLKGICRWSVDLEDCDCVLRIEAEKVEESDVVRTIQRAGLFCEPLEY
ncbi:hypothetical protein BN8_00160 [Fibrisoma limi BUZ 3]|uniref:HMA domain-containing protein n=1 Tax=Fibrisoma limi BUZ 3 TaxID=1185876 RepID=I2GBH0_9BACT|nr:hypothetical protein [Fibrisoma limi]CCH51244.1 hypothetical protein BN8_00160 [Fibrisoma limi BUZ 3]